VKREPHRWTREETEFLERHYTAQGAAWVAKRLGLTPKQVHNRAEHLGLEAFRPAVGHIRTAEAAFHAGVTPEHMHARALRAGVLRRVGRRADGRARFTTVPRKWAEEQAAMLKARQEATQREWVRLDEAAALTGLTVSTLHRATRGGSGLVNHLGVTLRCAVAASRTRFGRPAITIHPHDVDALRVALDKHRRFVATLVPLKTLAAECGVKLVTLHAALRRWGIEKITLPSRSTKISYVTHEAAAEVRRRYGRDLREAA